MPLADEWIQQSVQLARSAGYLDRLQVVYPLNPSEPGEISDEDWAPILTAYERANERPQDQDAQALTRVAQAKVVFVDLLLRATPRFPVEDSYVPFLRKLRRATEGNPEVVARLADRVLSLRPDEIRTLLNGPPKPSRQLGPAFGRWIREEFRREGWPVLAEADFDRAEGIALLDHTDAGLRDYAVRRLGLTPHKGLDMIARAGNARLVAEAKFISDDGGNQRNQFREAMQLLKDDAQGGVIRAAVLDGWVWLPTTRHEFTRDIAAHSQSDSVVATSALLLTELMRRLLEREQRP